MNLSIRTANPSEAGALSQIAWVAKRHWGYSETQMEGWRSALTITPEFIAANRVLVAVDEHDEVLGFAGLVRRQDLALLEHLWVRPDFMRRGVGRLLTRHALRLAAEDGATVVEVEADPHAEGFYLQLGAHRVNATTASRTQGSRTLPMLQFNVGSNQS